MTAAVIVPATATPIAPATAPAIVTVTMTAPGGRAGPLAR
jgi:hypothetical protein